MKNTVIAIALAAVLGLLAIGCHDEPVTPLPTVRNVDYIACGEQQRAAVGDDGWHALLDSLLSAAESGCHVTFWNPDAVGAKQADTITISTSDRREAYRWGEEMYDKGYVVSIIYDDATGTYRGTAVMATPAVSTPIPLSDYLPGTWVLDTTGPWNLIINNRGRFLMPVANSLFSMDSLIPADIIGMWQDTIGHHSMGFFNPATYRQEALYISSDSITASYPNPWGLTMAQYESLGFYDSVMTYHYDAPDDRAINLSTSHQLYYTYNCPTDNPMYNTPIPPMGKLYIFQISNNYMVIYGYTPRFYVAETGVVQPAFGFVKQ